LNICGKDVIWLSKDTEAFEELNLDIYDFDGNILFSMRENDWLIHAPFDDLECPPSASSLKFKSISQDIGITLEFSSLSKSDLYEMIKSLSRDIYRDIKEEIRRTWPKDDLTARILTSIEFDETIIKKQFQLINAELSDETITLCRLECHLIWPLDISLDKTKTIIPGQKILAGNFMVNGGVGVRIR
jgi:hypothetical protein